MKTISIQVAPRYVLLSDEIQSFAHGRQTECFDLWLPVMSLRRRICKHRHPHRCSLKKGVVCELGSWSYALMRLGAKV